jgi:hypothetical protein
LAPEAADEAAAGLTALASGAAAIARVASAATA